MIIDEYKTIFIHIPKTAGTSISSYFNERQIRLRVQPGKHDTINHIKQRFSNLYDSYSNFTVVRNPYDRMVSWYSFLKGNSSKEVVSFNEWIKDHSKLWHIDDPKYFAGPQYVWINETVSILKYENLKEDLNNFFNKKIDLPIINKSKRKDYLSYYNEESLDIVYNKHREDFKRFNYKKI